MFGRYIVEIHFGVDVGAALRIFIVYSVVGPNDKFVAFLLLLFVFSLFLGDVCRKLGKDSSGRGSGGAAPAALAALGAAAAMQAGPKGSRWMRE